MWNQIRGPPLVHRNQQTGQIVSFFILLQSTKKIELLFIILFQLFSALYFLLFALNLNLKTYKFVF